MKVSELFEAESTMGIIDREISKLLAKDKIGQSDMTKARNAYSRGFRSVFSGSLDTDSGIGQAFMKYVELGIKDGKKEAKKVKDIPVAFTKNMYGEKKKNAEFEKIVKTAMAPYLSSFALTESVGLQKVKNDGSIYSQSLTSPKSGPALYVDDGSDSDEGIPGVTLSLEDKENATKIEVTSSKNGRDLHKTKKFADTPEGYAAAKEYAETLAKELNLMPGGPAVKVTEKSIKELVYNAQDKMSDRYGYKYLMVDMSRKLVSYVSQQPYESEIAKKLAEIFTNAGIAGWTIRVVVRDTYHAADGKSDDRLPWKKATSKAKFKANEGLNEEQLDKKQEDQILKSFTAWNRGHAPKTKEDVDEYLDAVDDKIASIPAVRRFLIKCVRMNMNESYSELAGVFEKARKIITLLMKDPAAQVQSIKTDEDTMTVAINAPRGSQADLAVVKKIAGPEFTGVSGSPRSSVTADWTFTFAGDVDYKKLEKRLNGTNWTYN